MSEAQPEALPAGPKDSPGVRAMRQRMWSRFLGFTLLLHIPLYFYPILRLCYWLELPALATIVVFVPLAGSQIVSRIYLRGKRQWWARSYRKLADFWLGLSPLLLLTLLVFEVVVATTSLSAQFAALWVLAIALLLGAIGVWMAVRPQVVPVRFASAKLDRPVRFVQITDVHIGSRSPAFLRRVIDEVRRQEPEFLCITGDFIDETGVPESNLAALRDVSCPIYFCIGNHEKYEDLEQILERLDNLGVNILRNADLMHDDGIQVIGIDDMDDDRQVEREMSQINVSNDAFIILLYHRPRGLEAAAAAGVDLMLSGHTHNGQIFPFNLVVRRVFDRIVGLYQHGQARLYVSQGTGTWGPIMRVGTRSEITLFELLPE